jgi:mono/diheme cytochrome c family protein
MRLGIRLLLVAAMTTTTSMATAFGQGAAEDTYKSKCAMCHGAAGDANTPAGKAMKTPSFTDPSVTKMKDGDLFAATKNGKGKMPAYTGKLTDAQIRDVIAYVHTLQKM